MTPRRFFQDIFYPFSVNKMNRKLEANVDLNDSTPIYAFFHIYAANHWKDIVTELISTMKESGLYDKLSKIFVSVISQNQEDDVNFISGLIGEKGEIVFISDIATHYEFPILEHMLRMAKSGEKFYCVYFHSKGSSNSIKTVGNYGPGINTLKKLLKLSASTRKMLAYWSLSKWKLALATLQNGYSTYGCNYYHISDDCHFYGGNFWWSKSEYIKNRPEFLPELKTNRYFAEGWLLEHTDGIPYESFRTNCGDGLVLNPNIYASEGWKQATACIAAYPRYIFHGVNKIYHRFKKTNKPF